MKKTMPKPVNWQDFESLCKKLWGEIWCCDNIKKNGRSGQVQHGVDVYGIPTGKTMYFGIQCKGKDDYTKAQLTVGEIDEEIDKALTFKPQLCQFIFATTANKDAAIEEYIRIKNQENISIGKFCIDIFSWEDIVDLIEENKQTYDWYLKDVLHKNNNSFTVDINGENENLELKPIFNKTIVNVRSKIIIPTNPIDTLSTRLDQLTRISRIATASARIIWNAKKINNSLVELKIKFFNTGDTAIEHYKVIFTTDNNCVNFKEKNYESVGSMAIIEPFYPSNYFIEDKEITYVCPKERPILVPEDGRLINIYVELPTTPIEFDIHYKLMSRFYTTDGSIHITSNPQFEVKYVTRESSESEKERSYETITIKEETLEEQT